MQSQNNAKADVVMITGASSGIGEQMAYEAAKKGYQLVLCARRENELERVADVCRALSKMEVITYPMDLTDPSKVEEIVKDIITSVGTIDVLMNNAGFGLTEYFIDANLKTAEKMFDVNVLGALYVTQLVAIEMVENRKGHIFFTASMAGKLPTPKSSLYSATKAAVIAFCNSLRLELNPLNINVTTINIGPTDTPFFDTFDPEGTYLKRIKPLVLDANRVAEKTIETIGKSKREINMPWLMEVGSKMYHLFPTVGDAIILKFFDFK